MASIVLATGPLVEEWAGKEHVLAHTTPFQSSTGSPMHGY